MIALVSPFAVVSLNVGFGTAEAGILAYFVAFTRVANWRSSGKVRGKGIVR